MFVTVHLSSEIAADLAAKKPKLPETKKLLAIAKRHKASLEPMHPGTSDTELAKHFAIKTDQDSAAEAVRDELAATGLVQAAYVKPKDAPPR